MQIHDALQKMKDVGEGDQSSTVLRRGIGSLRGETGFTSIITILGHIWHKVAGWNSVAFGAARLR